MCCIKTHFKVERKRHLGNDVVLIIFREAGENNVPFNPKVIRSQFNRKVTPLKVLSCVLTPPSSLF